MATSVPVPIAKPTSARASAGASLMPSPTIPTVRPSARSRSISRALSAGRTSATTRVMPTRRATASAVRLSSPVTIATSRPSARRFSMAPAASGLTSSATATSPAAIPSTATYIDVFPSLASAVARSTSASTSTPRSRIRRRFPARMRRPSTVPATPFPAMASNSATGASAMARSAAPRTIAAPSGCSLTDSTEAASRSISSAAIGPTASTSVSVGTPRVMVPVLSRTIVSSLCAISRLSPVFTSTPSSAPFPVPTMIAVGVASPSAHGQAMMSTETKLTSASANRTSGGDATNQTTKVTTAIAMTTGVKIPEMTSARRAIGGFDPCASCTSLTICWSAVSRPTLVARNRNEPVALIVAANTSSPGRFSTGRDSPVSMDSSTADEPSTTRPSTAIFSPGRTTTRSPATTCSIGRSSSAPSRTTRAVFAWRPIRRRIASPARPRARASSSRPRSTSAMMTLAASK